MLPYMELVPVLCLHAYNDWYFQAKIACNYQLCHQNMISLFPETAIIKIYLINKRCTHGKITFMEPFSYLSLPMYPFVDGRK